MHVCMHAATCTCMFVIGKTACRYGLHAEPVNPAEPSNFVEVLDSMTNLGPIIDFVVVDLERQGQGQVLLLPLQLVQAAIPSHELCNANNTEWVFF